MFVIRNKLVFYLVIVYANLIQSENIRIVRVSKLQNDEPALDILLDNNIDIPINFDMNNINIIPVNIDMNRDWQSYKGNNKLMRKLVDILSLYSRNQRQIENDKETSLCDRHFASMYGAKAQRKHCLEKLHQKRQINKRSGHKMYIDNHANVKYSPKYNKVDYYNYLNPTRPFPYQLNSRDKEENDYADSYIDYISRNYKPERISTDYIDLADLGRKQREKNQNIKRHRSQCEDVTYNKNTQNKRCLNKRDNPTDNEDLNVHIDNRGREYYNENYLDINKPSPLQRLARNEPGTHIYPDSYLSSNNKQTLRFSTDYIDFRSDVLRSSRPITFLNVMLDPLISKRSKDTRSRKFSTMDQKSPKTAARTVFDSSEENEEISPNSKKRLKRFQVVTAEGSSDCKSNEINEFDDSQSEDEMMQKSYKKSPKKDNIYETDTDTESKNEVSDEFNESGSSVDIELPQKTNKKYQKRKKYIYSQGRIKVPVYSDDEDYRRRLQHFLPKRFHWEEGDLQRLGYFWFNGPQGKYSGPWKISK